MKNQIELQPTTIIARNENILMTDLDEVVVMMDVESGQYFNVDTVGASIWRKIEAPAQFSKIVAELKEEFDVDEETCESETRAFIEEMLELKLARLQ